MEKKNVLLDELISLLEKGNAHAPFEEVVSGMPLELLTVIPENLPYNIWQLAEHIRIAQWDIVEFCLSPDHQSPKWPEEYWPEAVEKVSREGWQNCLKEIKKDRDRFVSLLKKEADHLSVPFSYGEGQSLLREAMLIADHTAYHCGEILVIRRLLKCWK